MNAKHVKAPDAIRKEPYNIAVVGDGAPQRTNCLHSADRLSLDPLPVPSQNTSNILSLTTLILKKNIIIKTSISIQARLGRRLLSFNTSTAHSTTATSSTA